MILYYNTLKEAYTQHVPSIDQIIIDENGNVTVKTDEDKDVIITNEQQP